MLIIRNVTVYAPLFLGKKDLCICGEKIEWIADSILDLPFPCHTIDGTGLIATPGFIDQHVHVTGGGGEGGFHTRTPEVQLSELIRGGLTSVVGLLGTDGQTRSAENLYAKTAALNEEGLSAYMLSGAYGYPSPTITGSYEKDITFINEVLGIKLAISDHRAPNVSLQTLIEIASNVRVASMLSAKPGLITLHMGDNPTGLEPVFDALKKTALPPGIMRPTHVNRNAHLLEDGYTLLEMGGYVDYTCKMSGQPSPGKCILEAMKRELPLSRITFSSDGHGSWSRYREDGALLEIGVSGVDSMYQEFQNMVQNLAFSVEHALPYLTSNVADSLNLGRKKGRLNKGLDADILLFTENFDLHTVIARGQVMMENGGLLVQGTYENLLT